jgi:hypothetical protein
MFNLVDQIASTSQSFPVAIVTYQDFPDGHSPPYEYHGGSGDYPSNLDLDNVDAIQTGINSIILGNGGDTEETVLQASMLLLIWVGVKA